MLFERYPRLVKKFLAVAVILVICTRTCLPFTNVPVVLKVAMDPSPKYLS
jgi:hypothetical protein